MITAPVWVVVLVGFYLFFGGSYTTVTYIKWSRHGDSYFELDQMAYFIGALICGAVWPLTSVVTSFTTSVQEAMKKDAK